MTGHGTTAATRRECSEERNKLELVSADGQGNGGLMLAIDGVPDHQLLLTGGGGWVIVICASGYEFHNHQYLLPPKK